jgi:hypothetical protein
MATAITVTRTRKIDVIVGMAKVLGRMVQDSWVIKVWQ